MVVLIGELPLAQLAVAFLAVTEAKPRGSRHSLSCCAQAEQNRLLALARDNEPVVNIYISPITQPSAALSSCH